MRTGNRLGGLVATGNRWLDKAKHPTPKLDTPEEIRGLIAETVQQVRTGELPAPVASTVFYGLTVALRLADLEVSAKIAALELEFERRKALGR